MLKSLNVAQSGLSAAKIAVENVSNNIANENTPGYKKRVVQLSELELIDGRMTGRGVSADEAYRITSQYMYDNLMSENSKSNYYDEISSLVGNVEVMFQETDSSGFSSDLDRYFQSVENLRSNPNSEIYRTTYKTQANVLVDSLQNLYSNIEKQEELTRYSLEENVKKVNNLINEIGSINEQLGQHKVASNDLLDKRDELEKELSNYVDIEVNRSDDEYELKVAGSIAVRFSTNVREIELVDENTTQIDRFSFVDNDFDNNIYDGIKNIKNEDGTITAREFLPGDVVTYKLNNEYEVSVTIGQSILDPNNNAAEFDSTNSSSEDDVVSEDNLIRAIAYKINNDSRLSDSLEAYNGNYSIDSNGDKIDAVNQDKFLVIESKIEGKSAAFEGRISIESGINPTYQNDSDITATDFVDTAGNGTITINFEGVNKVFNITQNVTTYSDLVNSINLDSDLDASIIDGRLTINSADSVTALAITDSLSTSLGIDSVDLNRDTVFKDEYQSQEAENKVFLSIYDKETTISSGILKAQTENLTTNAINNKLVDYKEKLDNFARSLSDMYSKYVKTDEDEYLYGHVASDAYDGSESIKSINLFSGGDVKSLKFNESAVNDLLQSDLDYMGTIQWKKDIEFDGFEQDGSSVYATSFSEFYQEIRVNISSDKENNDFLLEAQESVEQSLQTNYDQLTKVDSDEEMVNLIKFQAAYTANAKIITVVDEMLQTILNIR